MSSKKHTYRFTHHGITYTRTTHRTYTHAIVLIRKSFIDYEAPPINHRYQSKACAPYVDAVCYSGSLALAQQKARDPWYAEAVIIALAQP